ncbi:MAG TPA: hypothetical protein VEC57_14395 [Candidatus Limnocylindrales bacterium]|nr:hypothetical protein [Candidatus Limnocylindrales bacterium]
MMESCTLLLAASMAAFVLLTSSGCTSGTWAKQEPAARDAHPAYPFRKATRVGSLSPAVSRPAVVAEAQASSIHSIAATMVPPHEAPVPGGHG